MSDRRKLSDLDRTFVLERGILVPKRSAVVCPKAMGFPFGVTGGGQGGGVAPIAFRSYSTNFRGTGLTAVSVTKPTGTASGDTLVAFCWDGNAGVADAAATGWSVVLSDNNNNPSLTVLTKSAGGSEPSSYSFNSDSGALVVDVVCLSGGLGLVDVVSSSPVSRISAGTSLSVASITAVAGGIAISDCAHASTTLSTGPSGWTSAGASASSSPRTDTYYKAVAAGAIGTQGYTFGSSSGVKMGAAIVIK